MNILKKKTWKYWRSNKLYIGMAVPQPRYFGALHPVYCASGGSRKWKNWEGGFGPGAVGAPRREMGGGGGDFGRASRSTHTHTPSEAKGVFIK